MSRSPYEILGVPRNATNDEIKKAYRKKARENHPDLNPDDPHASERMNEINDAYDRLMNPEKYAREDARASAYANRTTGGYGYGGVGSQGSQGAGQTRTGGYGWGGTGYGQGGYGSAGSATGSSGNRGQQTQDFGGFGWNTEGFSWEDFFGFGFGESAGNPRDIHPERESGDSAEVVSAINAINAKNYAHAVRILAAIPGAQRNARWYYLSSLANYGAGNVSLGYEQIRRACQLDPNNTRYRTALKSFQQPGRVYQQQSQQQGYGNAGPLSTAACCAGLSAMQFCMCPGFFCCI